MYTFERNQINKGIYLNTISQTPFKTNRISINCFFKLDKKTASGYAVLPFLLKKRTKKINSLIDMGRLTSNLYGASLSADCRKLGDNQVLTVSVSLLDNTYSLNNEELTEQALDLLLDIFLEPYLENGVFCESDLEIEKSNLEELLKSEFNDKRSYAINKCISLMCSEEPFGQNKYGDIKRIKELSKETAFEAYKHLIKSSNIQITAVLKNKYGRLADKINKRFGGINREDIYIPSTKKFSFESNPKEDEEVQKVQQSKLVMGFYAPTSDIKSDYSMFVLNCLFGGTPTSKLFENVREKLNLCYYCVSRYYLDKGIMLVDSGVEKQNRQKAVDEILNQLNSIKNGQVSDGLLNETKLSILNGLTSISDSPAAIEDWYLKQISQGREFSPLDIMNKVQDVDVKDIVNLAQGIKLCQTYILTGEQ